MTLYNSNVSIIYTWYCQHFDLLGQGVLSKVAELQWFMGCMVMGNPGIYQKLNEEISIEQ